MNAQEISGASGFVQGTLVGVTPAADGTGISAWYKWVPPTQAYATSGYIFDTRSQTNFKTLITVYMVYYNVPEPHAFSDLIETDYLSRTNFRAGYGYENGSLVGIPGYNQYTFYIRVQSRDGNVGVFGLKWRPYYAPLLGGCGRTAIDFYRVQGAKCVGTITYSRSAGAPAFQSFGTFPREAGKYRVERIDTRITFSPLVFVVNDVGYDAVAAGFRGWWSADVAYTAGDVIALNYGGVLTWLLQAVQDIPAGTSPWKAEGEGQGHNDLWVDLQSNQGITWDSACQMAEIASTPDHVPGPFVGGGIGLCLPADLEALPGAEEIASFRLIWLPLLLEIIVGGSFEVYSSDNFATWNFSFDVPNTSLVKWEDVSFELLASGGISNTANAGTHGSGTAINLVTLYVPGSTIYLLGGETTTAPVLTNTGWWMGVSTDPTAGLVTATVRVRFNTAVVGDLVFPLYPVITTAMRSTFVSNNGRQNAAIDVKVTAVGPWHMFGKLAASTGSTPSRLVLTLSRVDGLAFRNTTGGSVTSLTGTWQGVGATTVANPFFTFGVDAATTAQDVAFQLTIALQVSDTVFIPYPTLNGTLHVAAHV